MVPQPVKDALFAVNRLAAVPNLWLWETRFRLNRANQLCINLGCGPHYVEGMINCDGNLLNRIDLWLDLRNRLPFPDASVAVAYCSHTLEHLFPDSALKLLREVHRVLRPDGVVRLVVPDVAHALRIALGDASSHWPRAFRDSVGQAVNYLFCEGQHRYAYNYGMLVELASEAGFSEVTNISNEYGITPRAYGPLMLGGEGEGSLVTDLRKS
jgi:predicted SAM-dependent methyltransferase